MYKRQEGASDWIAGINHMGWLLKIEDKDGNDLYPEIKRRAAEKNATEKHKDMVRYEYIRRLGYYCTESSEHNAEYNPLFIKSRYPELIEQFNIPLDEYRKLFGMVLQDTWLFHGTISDNIRYGKLNATEEEVIQAAKAAHVHRFIQTLPGGYNMELNEEASNVSQGQKQLLTIARAILADNKILILDEATSSVDTRTEIEIQKAMDNLMKGRTSFVIAHRLSTIRDADLILVMKDGDIIEQGNHEELLAKNGFYANLYNSQFEDIVA